MYLFLIALGLHCCMLAFSSCREWGLLSRCGVLASHCGGFSSCRARALGAPASVVAANGLCSTGLIVVAHGLSCCTVCGIFLDRG